MEGRSGALVGDLDRILAEDLLIDEVALVPSVSPDALPLDHPPPALEGPSPYDPSAFWVGDHKLAIALQAAREMYAAAGKLLKDVRKRGGGDEAAVLRMTQAIVIVNPEHYTAWNTRKRLLQHASDPESAGRSELRLLALALSVHPKSEVSWAHRRWVLRCLLESGEAQQQDVLETESKLAQRCAELRPMNYRAWSHRSWCAQWFSTDQLKQELHTSRHWVEQHVNDNCGLHYRRRLLLLLLRLASKTDTPASASELHGDLVEQERAWLTPLLEYYQGREALWLHRRFLALVALPSNHKASPTCVSKNTKETSIHSEAVGISPLEGSITSVRLKDELPSSLPFSQHEVEFLKSAMEAGRNEASENLHMAADCSVCTQEELFVSSIIERTNKSNIEASLDTQRQSLLAGRHILWSRNMLCRQREPSTSLQPS